MDQNTTRLTPKVSVNIATYNRGNFIAEAIGSVLAQTFTDWELIIIDDASTDNTQEIIAPYLKDTRIKYFRNDKNLNISLTRNRGLAESSGEFIAILDSDDIWCSREKLREQVKFLEDNPSQVLVGTGIIKIDKTGHELGRYLNPLSDQAIRAQILAKNTFAHSSLLYHKNIAIDLGGYNPAISGIEDYDLWLKIGSKFKFSNLPVCYTKYRVHGSNISLTDRKRLMGINLDLIKKYKTSYPNYYPALLRRLSRYWAYRFLKIFS